MSPYEKVPRINRESALPVGLLLLTAIVCIVVGLRAIGARGVNDAAPKVSFNADLQPIIDKRCVFCHVTGAESGGLNLGRSLARRNLVSVPSTESSLMRVEPGNPDKSYIIHKLKGTQATVGGIGGRMPLSDAPISLSESEIQLFVQWIHEGALDN